MKKQTDKTLTSVELFACIGGFRIAAENLGIRTVWANDIDLHAAQVYTDRFGKEGFVRGDLWKLIDETPSHDILTGGFPCQPFSAGKKKGIEDPRGTLFEAIVRILQKHRPRYFILGNVKDCWEWISPCRRTVRESSSREPGTKIVDSGLLPWKKCIL